MGKFGLYLIGLLFLIVLMSSVFAGDVAYIYSSKSKIDSNVIGVFNELGLGVDYIHINNLPKDFSKYAFLYVGDEYFSKDIPVTNHNSIISNPYLGERSGITDRSGISIMTSTEAPRVTLNGSNVKVYIVAKDNRGIYIPYYFLSDKHKAFSSRGYAGTYSTSSGNFGDVISFIDKNSMLENGKISKGNICFFGISKSSYWTSDAKKLFKDCVGFVNTLESSENNTNSSNVSIACSKDLDCGISGYTGFDFCSEKNILNTFVNYKCENPGTSSSFCSSQTTNELVGSCSDFCVEGDCQNFKCIDDGQCDDNDGTTKDVCMKPSTKDAVCFNIPYFIQCRTDLDCNDNNKSTEDFCVNPSTKESSCVLNIYNIRCIKDLDCEDNNYLTSDSCANPGLFISSCVHNIFNIRCSRDSDCSDGDAFTTDACISPGQINSSCSFSTISNISYVRIVSLTAVPNVTSVKLDFNVEIFGSSGIKGYYFSADKDNWTFVSANETSYVFDNLLPLTNYTFFMRVVDNLDASSSEVNVSVITLAAVDSGSGSGGGGGSDGGNNGGGGSGGNGGGNGNSGLISTTQSLNGYSSGGVCVTKWSCTEWSSCINGKQSRTCYYPPTFCTPKAVKPAESNACVVAFEDNLDSGLNEFEEQPIEQGSSITGGVIGALGKPLLWVSLFLIIIAGIYLYVRFRA